MAARASLSARTFAVMLCFGYIVALYAGAGIDEAFGPLRAPVAWGAAAALVATLAAASTIARVGFLSRTDSTTSAIAAGMGKPIASAKTMQKITAYP